MKAITRALLIGLLFVGSAYADDPAKTTDTTKTTDAKDTAKKDTAKKEKLTADELQVLAHYHAVNLMEIDLGKVAKKQAGSQAVKAYGEMLIKDHSEGDAKMKAFAKKMGQMIPAEKLATDAEKADKADTKKQVAELKKLKGADFDRAYLQMMVAGHEKELAMIDSKMSMVQNTELTDMLRAKKDVLQHHADAARELQKNNAQAMNQPHTTAPQTNQPRK